MNTPPNKIKFLSDGCEAELVHKIGPAGKDIAYWYRYTKSITNLGAEFPISMIQLAKLESMKLLITE